MNGSWSQRLHRPNAGKLLALLFWLMLLAVYFAGLRLYDLTPAASISRLAGWLDSSFWGPLLFIVLYVVGPLLFFPATILSLLGGFVFGPAGILYTIVGSNSSAMVAFWIGRYFGHGALRTGGEAGRLAKYTRRIRENSFEAVLIMHLIFLPYELVNYTCGFLQIGWKPFLAGTALGSVVATISIVTLGASFGSIEQVVAGEVRLDPLMLAASLGLIATSLALSRTFKNRE